MRTSYIRKHVRNADTFTENTFYTESHFNQQQYFLETAKSVS